MKPQEILNEYGINPDNWGNYYTYIAQADTKHSINNYLDKDCIIAYQKGFLGFVFIIKSAKKHFAYVGIKAGVDLGGMGYVFRRIYKMKIALKLLGEKYNVLDKDELNKIKDLCLLENLEDKEY